MQHNIRLTGCPRDAIQGIKNIIPTICKAEYLQSLLKVGFDILDFGSFVSPKAIPQLADTAEVVKKLKLSDTNTKLLAIIGNLRGAREACQFDEIDYLGFPFSISDTFLRLNINSNINKAFDLCKELLELSNKNNKTLMIYLSMAFGNKYNDPWSAELIAEWVEKLNDIGATEINLSDTVGVSTTKSVQDVFGLLDKKFPKVNIGFHLHTRPELWREKLDLAFKNGCRSFDGVLSGKGGCPMTGSEMVDNLHVRNIVDYFDSQNVKLDLNREALDKAYYVAAQILDEFF